MGFSLTPGSSTFLALAGLGLTLSSGRKARKTQKHAKKRAIGKEVQMAETATQETRELEFEAGEKRRKRSLSVGRNVTLFNPLGLAGQAQTARKTLTGQ